MKKKKPTYPRRKRMKKAERLVSAKKWITEYGGKSIVKGYAKWYGVSKLSAVNELKMLGIQIDEEYIKQLKKSEEEKIKRNRKKKEEKALLKKIEEIELEMVPEYSENFYALNCLSDEESEGCKTEEKKCSKCDVCYDQELPF